MWTLFSLAPTRRLGLGALILSVLSLWSMDLVAQTTLRGQVLDGATGEPMFAANVLEDGTSNGVTTDFDGQFRLVVDALPVTLNVSFIGYAVKQVSVKEANQRIVVKLESDQVLIEAAEVVGERISEKQKQAPLTVETMDALAIKEAPTGSFYEGLGNLKGVDLTSASLGFKIINTRGFNSTSPVRSLQLIDGVDNQSPGLNFSLGNFLGAPDLDVKSVEIVAGASSAYFGPGAFNGVINMETKDPFVFDGLSASYKMGERSLNELGFRWAQKIENSDGDPFFAYKVNAFAFSAYDWEATNYNPIDGSLVDASNPGRFDAVNIYGDEYNSSLDLSGDNSATNRGLGTFYRTGYREVDLVDYNTNNLKVSLASHLRLKPEDGYESPELIYAFNMGRGTTVYQGDNRFSLRDIEFYQHRAELRKKGDWFLRVYRTSEDAGNSYDPYATALQLRDSVIEYADWRNRYIDYWAQNIRPQIDDSYPLPVRIEDSLAYFPIRQARRTQIYRYPRYQIPQDSVEQWFIDNADNLINWHSEAEAWANGDLDGDGELGYADPGSAQFQSLFDQLVSSKNNEEEGGTRFFDRSSLVHIHGEKIFKPWWMDEIRVGSNARRYTPNSEGTIFSDTNGRVITNQEVGIYTGVKKRFLEDKFIATATYRADKNQNFDWVHSPAASLVWMPTTKDFLRVSFSSALRNPTLADQYLYLNVGPATLVGNLEGAEDLVTVQSFIDYRNSSSGLNIAFNRDTLQYFDIAALRPEQVRTLEAGYRTTFGDKLYLDANYYFSWYTDFIGYNIGLDVQFQNPTTPDFVTGVDVYRYAANSLNQVQTQGASLGLNYFLSDELTVSGNYSWNKLVKTDEDDPIIPAFNTPEHKFNLGLTARGYDGVGKDKWGFGINYRWVQGFLFEGSPQFTGFVPQYDLVDAQINYRFDAQRLTLKVGGSNLLRNEHIETYGGPTVGRLAYVSLLLDAKK